ncbi:MAG: hypothetical protein R2715_03550 [Ilumatobacteraceae bacterium]
MRSRWHHGVNASFETLVDLGLELSQDYGAESGDDRLVVISSGYTGPVQVDGSADAGARSVPLTEVPPIQLLLIGAGDFSGVVDRPALSAVTNARNDAMSTCEAFLAAGGADCTHLNRLDAPPPD